LLLGYEQLLLLLFLSVAFALAPVATNLFFMGRSRAYSIAHGMALFSLLLGFTLNLTFFAIAWPLFCVFGFLLFLARTRPAPLSLAWIASTIPMVFSLISATWFTAGVFDWHLLGYSRSWSFYAAIHGSFIGWILLGCFASLAQRESQRVYSYGCFFIFLCFLSIAFGINGIPYIKSVGVIGVSLAIPCLMAKLTFDLGKENRRSFALAVISLVSVILALGLALLHHFWVDFPRIVAGVPTMVIIHGTLNGLIGVPCFFTAIQRRKIGGQHQATPHKVHLPSS
jgi:hypothetical protein